MLVSRVLVSRDELVSVLMNASSYDLLFCINYKPKHRAVHDMHAFLKSNTFMSNVRLKLGKNQANVKQHHGAELLLFENYLHSSSTSLSKNNRAYSKE